MFPYFTYRKNGLFVEKKNNGQSRRASRDRAHEIR